MQPQFSNEEEEENKSFEGHPESNSDKSSTSSNRSGKNKTKRNSVINENAKELAKALLEEQEIKHV